MARPSGASLSPPSPSSSSPNIIAPLAMPGTAATSQACRRPRDSAPAPEITRPPITASGPPTPPE